LLPRNLLSYSLCGDVIVPHYLSQRDEVWVRELVDTLDALVGRKLGDADSILNDALPKLAAAHGVPISLVRAVRHILEKLWRGDVRAAAPPREIRRVVFEIASDVKVPRAEVLGRSAAQLGIRTEEVAEGLFADRPSERRLTAPKSEPSTKQITELHNLALAQGFLLRSDGIVAHVRAHALSVIRFAKWKGLLCWYVIEPSGTQIVLSGPLAIFRHTLKYGLALANFFPALVVTPEWSLDATCQIGEGFARFHADASDPIAATHVLPQDTDSLLEKHFLQDFRRLGSSWSLRRETAALQVGTGTFFPDFTLEAGDRRVHLEIVGFYTPEYLESKLRALREARLTNVVVCIDESLACADEDIVADAIVRFRRRLDAEEVLRAVNRCAPAPTHRDDTRAERS
jgi:predicted nuclease of restriction endonuclease-like RecB superfamily